MAWRALGSPSCELGESPFWQAGDGRLYWVDIAGRAALRADPATGATERWPLPEEPGCMAPARTAGAASGWVLALRSGIYRARHWGGELVRIARLPYDPAHERANDGKCDPLGRFWVGTRDERPGASAGHGQAAMYCIDARFSTAQVQTMWGGAGTLNGLAWSPDQRTLYAADTPTHRIEVRGWEAAANTLGPARALRQFSPKPPGWTPGTAGYGGRPTARRWTLAATTGARCTKAAAYCSSRPLARCCARSPRRSPARPWSVWAGRSCARCSSPARATADRRRNWNARRWRARYWRCKSRSRLPGCR